MTDDRRRTQSDGKNSYCLWQGLLKRIIKYKYLLVMYRIKCYTISALVNF
jgi:hypothetical protein